MPFVLPRAATVPGRPAFVLAFGTPSVLEICSVMERSISDVKQPHERICTAVLEPSAEASVPALAGIHKYGRVLEVGEDGEGIGEALEPVVEGVDRISNVSVSAYGLEEDSYEHLVSILMTSFRDMGVKKVHLVRSRGNELFADKVVSREALDFIAFPAPRGFYFGPTSFVAETGSVRERGVSRPAPRPEISLSPRLAKLMVNLTGLKRGQTLLDPFCGSGAILAEGLVQGLRCLGIDSSAARVGEARSNLKWVSRGRRSSFDVRAGDARALGGLLGEGRVDGVATEPILLPGLKQSPHPEEAKGMIDEAGSSYAEALASMAEHTRPGGRIVITVPVVRATGGSEVSLALQGRPLGLKEFQPGNVRFSYPVRLSFESTRWVKRALYVFEAAG